MIRPQTWIIAWVLLAIAAVAVLGTLGTRAQRAERHALAQRAMLSRVASDALELARLRAAEPSRHDRDATGDAPKLAPTVSTALTACGLPIATLASLSPESESVETAASQARIIRCRATLVLTPITLPQLGRLLNDWRERSPEWMPSRLDMEPRREPGLATPGADLPLRVVLAIESLRVAAEEATGIGQGARGAEGR